MYKFTLNYVANQVNPMLTGQKKAYPVGRYIISVALNGAHQLFAEQVLNIVSKYDGAVRYDASF